MEKQSFFAVIESFGVARLNLSVFAPLEVKS